MTEQLFWDNLSNAAPIVVLFIAVAVCVLAALRAAPGIQEKEIRRLEVIGENRKAEAEEQGRIADSQMRALEVLTQGTREFMLEQRKFHAERTDSLLQQMRVLEGQIAELKDELKQKDITIRSQAQRIESLEAENVSHKRELESLRRKSDEGKRPAGKKVA